MLILLTLCITFVTVLIVLWLSYRAYTFIKWFILLKDYQKISDRLDDDIKLLRDGKLEEAILREAKSDKMIWEFKRKYPKEL
jgi:hypothetical protein